MPETVRIDKWLWEVRLFKTRSLATDACNKGHVLAEGIPVKPSRHVKTGDVYKIRRAPIYRTYQVLGFPKSRVGAPEVPNYLSDITPPEELKLLEMQKDMVWITRDRGTGRPTKKERRDLDDFFER
ncbi:MAG TPA: RNA-binding S4 domain-containing protein [Prolixibacteraceae bacterium]|nr:RNA-binding S4 domain-containing protein [Prolixibacteraceae bacterium]